MLRKKLFVGMTVALLSSLTLVGCGSGDSGSTKVTVVGSTTVAVPMEMLADTYQELNPDAVIEVQGVGSSAGVKAANEKTADIGMASRELKEEERGYGLIETAVAHDGIALVVHPSNGVSDLTMEEVRGIYEGTITNWSEVGGADQEIIVVTREEGSGTRSAFEEIVGLLEDRDGKDVTTITQNALVGDGNGTVKARVVATEASIGYISLGTVDETVSPLTVDGVEPTVENIQDGLYSVSRRLLILTQPGASEETQAFLNFILSDEGQEVVSEHYIPVN